MSGSIQGTTSTQSINGQYQIAPEKTSVSQLPANKAMEALAETMQENIGSTQKIAYRSISEGTKGLPVYKAIWQGIKNISHNIEAFAKNTWNAEKRTQSALNIAKGALAIAKNLKDKGKAEELIQAFKNDPKSAMEMMDALKTQKETILNQITEWHEKGKIPEEKVAVEGEGEHAGKVGTLKHSGDCGLLLQTALNNLSAVGKLLAACAKEANEIGQQEIQLQKDTEIYNKYPTLKSFFETTLNTFTKVRDALNEARSQDPTASLPGTQEEINAADIAYKTYNTGMEVNKDTLEKLKENVAVKGIRKKIHTISKEISDIMQKFTENTRVEYQKFSEKI